MSDDMRRHIVIDPRHDPVRILFSSEDDYMEESLKSVIEDWIFLKQEEITENFEKLKEIFDSIQSRISPSPPASDDRG